MWNLKFYWILKPNKKVIHRTENSWLARFKGIFLLLLKLHCTGFYLKLLVFSELKHLRADTLHSDFPWLNCRIASRHSEDCFEWVVCWTYCHEMINNVVGIDWTVKWIWHWFIAKFTVITHVLPWKTLWVIHVHQHRFYSHTHTHTPQILKQS